MVSTKWSFFRKSYRQVRCSEVRVLLLGRTGLGNSALRALQKAGSDIVAAIVRKEDRDLPYCPREDILELLGRWGVKVYENLDPKSIDTLELVRNLKPDLILAADFHDVMPKKTTSLPLYGAINIHMSLLPRYRGPTPTNWMLIQGETEAGVTAYRLTEHLYIGDIIAQKKISIDINFTDGILREALGKLAEELILQLLETLESQGKLEARPYDFTNITSYPEITEQDGFIKFDEPVLNIHNRIRGTTPFPGAYTYLKDRRIKIAGSWVLEGKACEVKPGIIYERDDDSLIVGAEDGLIKIKIANVEKLDLSDGKLAVTQKAPITDTERSGIVHTQEEYGFKPGAEEFPKMVVAAVTYVCNAKCPNCPYTETNSILRRMYSDAQFMPPDLFKKIADECGRFNAFIRLTGGGEPLLHPAMVDLIEYAKDAGARIWLNTNGSLLRKDVADRLVTANTDVIEFSVDAADPETYALVRPGLNFDRLLSNMTYIIQRRNELKKECKIVASVIIQKIVKDKINDIVKFWLDFGVDEVIKRKFLTWGSSTKLKPDDSGDPLPYLDKFYRIPCPWLFERINVDTRGNVTVCGYDIFGRINLGNLYKQSIREIWRGPELERWRKIHLSRKSTSISLCRECPDIQYRSWKYCWERVIERAKERRKFQLRG
jgi:radical SAM protein with 4Fe4S-binding SPASM domain